MKRSLTKSLNYATMELINLNPKLRKETMAKNSEKQLSRWQRALTDLNAINSNDKVESYYTANWASSSFAIFATWRKGTLLFTKERLVFMTTFGVNQLTIDYSDIREAKKCFAGLLPMGMLVVAYDKKTDKTKKYKFWVTGRKKLIRQIAEKAGLAQ